MDEAKMEMEKYSKYLFFKSAQIIVQSRQGSKLCTESQAHPKNQSWFCLAINDNSEITHEAKRTASCSQLSGCSIWSQPLCIEISLKTMEGEGLVLETWVLSLREGADSSVRLANTVYNRMGLLLKSLLCVSRALPAYKLSRRQGPETFVMCYRVFTGEVSSSQLGNGFQTCHVGQVVTQAGTISLRVDYRTQMTISPPTSSLGMEPYYVQPILVKSDHFSDLETSSNPASKSGPTFPKPYPGLIPGVNANNNSESSEQAMTSDESQEAMRLFAASPPEGMFVQGGHQFASPRSHRQRRLNSGDHHSSNESLGRKISFRPRSGTNQSGASDEADNENVKCGAFAAKRDIFSRKVGTLNAGKEGEDDDSPLLELFTVDSSDTETATKNLIPKSPVPNLESKMQQLNLGADKSKQPPQTSAIRKITFDDPPVDSALSATSKPAMANKQGDDFVMLDFKTPFSIGSRPLSAASDLQSSVTAATTDLGIFFKDVSSAPCLKSSFSSPLKSVRRDQQLQQQASLNEGDEEEEDCFYSLEEQLKNLNDDLTTFEHNLNDYDNMLKNLDTNSESELD